MIRPCSIETTHSGTRPAARAGWHAQGSLGIGGSREPRIAPGERGLQSLLADPLLELGARHDTASPDGVTASSFRS